MPRPERFKNARGSMDKLTRHNYHLWSGDILCLSESDEIQELILGKLLRPGDLPESATEANKNERKAKQLSWDKMNKDAITMLRMSSCDEIRPTIPKGYSASSIWNLLKNRFDPTSELLYTDGRNNTKFSSFNQNQSNFGAQHSGYSQNQNYNSEPNQGYNNSRAPYHNPNYIQGTGCDYHQTTSHLTINCKNLRKRRVDDGGDTNNPECTHCRQSGHRSHNCPRRRPFRRQDDTYRNSFNSNHRNQTNYNNHMPPPVQQNSAGNNMSFQDKDYSKEFAEFLAQKRSASQANFVETSTRSSNNSSPNGGTSNTHTKPDSPSSSSSSTSDLSQC
ncbi:hypothetical protein EDC01DRAFT_627107 [Geopyxis carbonaria]|nr:hypothetical protein EDC01DRAFT_627107 [Geopyxis carbonaria]